VTAGTIWCKSAMLVKKKMKLRYVQSQVTVTHSCLITVCQSSAWSPEQKKVRSQWSRKPGHMYGHRNWRVRQRTRSPSTSQSKATLFEELKRFCRTQIWIRRKSLSACTVFPSFPAQLLVCKSHLVRYALQKRFCKRRYDGKDEKKNTGIHLQEIR
jgi:hypothetical protein